MILDSHSLQDRKAPTPGRMSETGLRFVCSFNGTLWSFGPLVVPRNNVFMVGFLFIFWQGNMGDVIHVPATAFIKVLTEVTCNEMQQCP